MAISSMMQEVHSQEIQLVLGIFLSIFEIGFQKIEKFINITRITQKFWKNNSGDVGK
jgi:hypothetical protein